MNAWKRKLLNSFLQTKRLALANAQLKFNRAQKSYEHSRTRAENAHSEHLGKYGNNAKILCAPLKKLSFALNLSADRSPLSKERSHSEHNHSDSARSTETSYQFERIVELHKQKRKKAFKTDQKTFKRLQRLMIRALKIGT